MSKFTKAIAEIADCKPSDLVKREWDHYGLDVYTVGTNGDEYAVGTDEQFDETAAEYIKNSLWAFNASWLAEYTDLPEEVFEGLQGRYEDANDAVLTLIERADGGLEDFVERSISADGRGHFLSSYDGNEHEITVTTKSGEHTLWVVRV